MELRPMKIINEWVIEKKSSVHGKGLFARKTIPKGTQVIEYVGEKITKVEAEKRGGQQYEQGEKGHEGHVYLFELNKRYDIDGNVSWNPARLINHSCNPNCDTCNDKGHIWIEALKTIKEGEELSYNYGYGWDKDFVDHPCKCGSNNCIGYILDKKYWRKVKKFLTNNRK